MYKYILAAIKWLSPFFFFKLDISGRISKYEIRENYIIAASTVDLYIVYF